VCGLWVALWCWLGFGGIDACPLKDSQWFGGWVAFLPPVAIAVHEGNEMVVVAPRWSTVSVDPDQHFGHGGNWVHGVIDLDPLAHFEFLSRMDRRSGPSV